MGRHGRMGRREWEERAFHHQQEQVLYDSRLTPPGAQTTGGTHTFPYGHTTQYGPGWHASWNGTGDPSQAQDFHYTNQQVPPNHPDRHNDPRQGS